LAAGVILFSLAGSIQAQCPEDPNDSGICDSFYVEVYPPDQVVSGDPPFSVRLTIYVTHDLPNPDIDSLAGFTAALCYEHTNSSKYCSLTADWNNTWVYPQSDLDRSIFRHFIQGEDTLIHNWMMDQSQRMMGLEWAFRFVALDGDSHYWLSLIPTSSANQRFWEGSRVLLATMNFKLQDSTTICVDTCFWPAGHPLVFCRSDAITYVPRHNLPYCVSISKPVYDRGDANGDGTITMADVLHMLNYLFKQGPPPVSFVAGDANCDDDLGILDPLYLLNYLYREGPPPGC
jgi:hypothetical protein